MASRMLRYSLCCSLHQRRLPTVLSSIVLSRNAYHNVRAATVTTNTSFFSPSHFRLSNLRMVVGVALVTGFSVASWKSHDAWAEAQRPDARMLRRIKRENTDRSITTQNFHYYEGAKVLHNFVLLSGNSNPSLCNQIARYLGIKRAPAKVAAFSDGETAIDVKVNTAGKHVVIVQSTSPPTNDNLIELLLMVSAVRRDNAKHVTVVIPYFGYGRQDGPRQRNDDSILSTSTESFVPISAADVALMISQSGVDRVITLDLHSPQV